MFSTVGRLAPGPSTAVVLGAAVVLCVLDAVLAALELCVLDDVLDALELCVLDAVLEPGFELLLSSPEEELLCFEPDSEELDFVPCPDSELFFDVTSVSGSSSIHMVSPLLLVSYSLLALLEDLLELLELEDSSASLLL